MPSCRTDNTRILKSLTSSSFSTHSLPPAKLSAAIVAIMLTSMGSAQASEYNSVTFFGDSLTDGGYFKSISAKEQSGQFTTNPDNTWATSFAAQLGHTAVADSIDGTTVNNLPVNNYAIGGARSGIKVDRGGLLIASASDQVDKHLANNRIDSKGLYSVWIGANDLLSVVSDLPNADNIITAATQSQIETISKLQENGANYILVPNIPDVGLTPYLASAEESLQAFGTGLSSKYNDVLFKGAAATGANIIPLDTFSLLQQVAADPAAYGYSNISKAACNTSSSLDCGRDDLVEPGANQTYFFADSIHPAGRAHQMIADYANAVVTAPSEVSLLPHIATTSALATNARLQTHINQYQNGNNQSLKQSGPALWASADVNSTDIAHLDSNGNMQLLVGLDIADDSSENAVSGIYANISQTKLDSDIRSGLSKVDHDELGIGFYHSNQFGGVQVNGAVGYGNIDMDVSRRVSLDNYRQIFKSDVNGDRYYGALQAGYPMQMPDAFQFNQTTITPYLGATINRIKLGKMIEREPTGVAMEFDRQKYTTTYGTFGLKANSRLNSTLNVFGDLHYQKQIDDSRDEVTARLNTLSNVPFTTPKADIDDDSFGVTLGLSRQFGAINANAGVSHASGDDDENTSVFIGMSSAF